MKKQMKYRYQKNDHTCQLVARVNANVYLGGKYTPDGIFEDLRKECGCVEPDQPCYEITKAEPYLNLYLNDIIKFDQPIISVGAIMDKLEQGFAVIITLTGDLNHQTLAIDTMGRYKIRVIDSFRKIVDVRLFDIEKIYIFERHEYFY